MILNHTNTNAALFGVMLFAPMAAFIIYWLFASSLYVANLEQGRERGPLA